MHRLSPGALPANCMAAQRKAILGFLLGSVHWPDRSASRDRQDHAL